MHLWFTWDIRNHMNVLTDWLIIKRKVHKWSYCMLMTIHSTYSHYFHLTHQLSLLPFVGQELSSSLRATGWRPSVADWGGGMSANCLLAWAMDGRIMRCGIISSCQSVATFEIVKRSWEYVCPASALYQILDLYIHTHFRLFLNRPIYP